MRETFEDYMETVIEVAESNYEITKDELVYNEDQFRQYYEDGTSAEKAVLLIANYCL